MTSLLAPEREPPLTATATPDPQLPSRRLSHPHLVKGAIVLADATALAFAAMAALAWRSSLPGEDPTYELREHLVLGLTAIPLWLLLFAQGRLYTSRFVVRRLDEFRRVTSALVNGFVCLAAISYVLQLPISRAWLMLTALFGTALVMAEREVVRRLFARSRRRGSLLKPVIIVGSNEEALELAEMLYADPALGYAVAGFVDDHPRSDEGVLGPVEKTLEVAQRTGATGVIIATSAMEVGACNHLVRKLLAAGVHVELSSTLRDIAAERLSVRALGRFPIVYLERRGVVGWRRVAKRAFDITMSCIALALALPAAALISIAIKLDSCGPVIYRQRRLGKDGEPFTVLKFRTMVPNAEELLSGLRHRNEADGPLFKLKDDPRVTRVGRFLRKTSLDELPQLLNVFVGDMSIVGPRPALPSELDQWQPELHARLRVRPGITGMWQVSGRSDASFESYTRLDLYYVENWSLVTDLAIVAKTVPTVLFGRGAY